MAIKVALLASLFSLIAARTSLSSGIRSLPADEEEAAIVAFARKHDEVFKNLEDRYADHWAFVSYLKNSSNAPILNLDVLVPPCFEIIYQSQVVFGNSDQIGLSSRRLTFEEITSLDFDTRNVRFGQGGEISQADREKFVAGAKLPIPRSASTVDFKTLKRYWNTIVYPK
jgi:hypothetical protein